MSSGRSRRRWGATAIAVAAMIATAAGTGLAAPAPAGSGVISTFAGAFGAGPATNVGQDAANVAVAGRTLYLVTIPSARSTRGPVLRAVDLDTGIERTVAGTGEWGPAVDGTATASPFNHIGDVTFDNAGNVLFTADGRVRRVDAAGRMTSIAGGGTRTEDGIPAGEALLRWMSGLAVDSAGALYISDFTKVRRVDPNGTISTVAGVGGSSQFDGDGGPAVKAHLNGAGDLAFDPAGNLHIADGSRVRRVDRQGIITTVAGGGTYPFGASGVRATEVELGANGMTFDAAGNLFVADWRWVRRIDTGGRITTVAGNGDAAFRTDGREVATGDGERATGVAVAPSSVAVDAAGNVYAAEWGRARVRRIAPSGIINTVAGNGTMRLGGDGGPARLAQLWEPRAADVDRAGNVYIADSENGRVRKVAPDGSITSLRQRFQFPYAVAVDATGRLFVGAGEGVMRVDPDGLVTRWAGGGVEDPVDGQPATRGMVSPAQMVVDAAGNLYIAGGKLYKVDVAGVLTTVAGGGATAPADGVAARSASVWASAVALDGASRVIFTDVTSHRIWQVGTDGRLATVAGTTRGFGGDGGPASGAQLSLGDRYYNTTSSLAVDGGGQIFVLDTDNNVVRRIDTAGVITTVAGNGDRNPSLVRVPPTADGVPATSVANAALDIAVNGSTLLLVETLYDRVRSVPGVALAAPPATAASALAIAAPSGAPAPTSTTSVAGTTRASVPVTSTIASPTPTAAPASGAGTAASVTGARVEEAPPGAPSLVVAGRSVAATAAPVMWTWRLAGVLALAAATWSGLWTWRRRRA